MSAITNTLKIAKEILWVIKAEIGGQNYWWSTKTFSIPNSGGDDIAVDGLLLSEISFSQSIDLRQLRSAIPSITIQVANKNRIQDIESFVEIDNSYANIYVYCDGLDWTDIETEGLLIRGLLRKESHSRTVYVFSIQDMTKSFSESIPPSSISTGNWPSCRLIDGGGSVAGLPQSLIFGDWPKGIPLLCVDTVTFLYLACAHGVLSTDAEYTATTENVYDNTGAVIGAGGYVFILGYDSLGNIVSYFDFNADQTALESLSCSIRGMKDDGAGTYTGTASALIENPGDLIHYIFANFTKIENDYLDIGSFKTLRSLLPGLKMASIVNDPTDALDFLNRLCSQIGAIICLRPGGKIGTMAFDFDGISIGNIDCKTDAIDGTINFTRTPLDSVVNRLTAKFAFNPSTKAFEALYLKDRTNNTYCEKSYYDYGETPMATVEFYDIQEVASMDQVLDRYLQLYSKRRDILSFSSPIFVVWDYVVGDIVEITAEDGKSIDGTGWDERQCILIEKDYQDGIANTKWLDIE